MSSKRLRVSVSVVFALLLVAFTVTACGGSSDEESAATWELAGETGSITVTAPTDSDPPVVDVDTPFTVTETQVHVLTEGDGPVVGETDTVSVDYLGVNGRDGEPFDSSYTRGAPVDFPLTGVVPGFQKAIAGNKVGSTVAVAMIPADGYPQGQPSAGITPDDTLVFVIEIEDAQAS